jgi:hypothetical protein
MAITLDYSDPVFFAICGGECSRHRPGQNVSKYFAKAYNVREWKRKPKCDNCDTPMRLLYEVKRDA